MISLVTNIDSLLAQQNLNVNSKFQSNTIQQLTSGYRINSSADDAAGLSVANSYRNQIAELNQGVLNANQGVSQLQIIDGGLSNISQMLDRLQTLATEAASQTFTGNRATLNSEYQSLLTEIGRQADNVGLGDNNKSNSANIAVYIGGGQDAATNSSVNVNLANQSVSAAGLGLAGTSVLTNGVVQLSTANTASLIGAGHTDTFTVDTASGTSTITVTGNAGDSIQTQVNELAAQMNVLGISASLNSSGQLQFQSSNAFTIKAAASNGPDLVTNNTTATNTGLNNLQYSTVTAADVLQVTVGSTTASVTLAAGATQDSVNLINSSLQAQGITGVTAVLDATTAGAISLQGASNFSATVTGTGTVANSGVPTGMETAGNPSIAIDAITQAVSSLGTVQGVVGAGENTLNYAINLAQSQITSFSAAQSQIRDANVAQEAANLTKAQVMQQASIAAMAQANQEPQAVLALLKQSARRQGW
ncbi:MAG TPA: flagellin [Bryobacteraceae bacterium]|nr:flagellin [Bryobacteraceae bacterium]